MHLIADSSAISSRGEAGCRGREIARCSPLHEQEGQIHPQTCRHLLPRRGGAGGPGVGHAAGERVHRTGGGARLRLPVQSGHARVGTGGGRDHLCREEGRCPHVAPGGDQRPARRENAGWQTRCQVERRRPVCFWEGWRRGVGAGRGGLEVRGRARGVVHGGGTGVRGGFP